MAEYSKTWTWFDGQWLEGNPSLWGPRTHASWLGSSVFDGARGFDGMMPDIALHSSRVNDSAVALGMKPTMRTEEIVELSREGMRKFGGDEAVYIRPMYWAEADGSQVINPDPDSTRFLLCLFEAPLPPKDKSSSLTLSPFRRPTMEIMPVNAKAGCLYPNNARAAVEATGRGFDNALVKDMLGNIAELTTANVFMVKDGEVFTPFWNGTFLNGITRQRIIKLLTEQNIKVHEATLSYDDFYGADEIFSTGNYAKVGPVNRLDDRVLKVGEITNLARSLYWEFAHEKAERY
ncbi:branched-chain amino acid aminotransferase [Flexibacterium corallicola]|uniref:branched-chain amino acid aminotransferase n=1 Tax=Flexibacterium corallicola TaxID=3037259 RepID=UPI00286ED13E|nr:branched-chain amino acid aminotransferase [Pseudovibrio sp. M1P-2-3]